MTLLRYQSVDVSVTDTTTTHYFNVESGTVAFDEGWTPYLQANLTLTLPMLDGRPPSLDTSALEALDPRNKLRMLLVATLYEYDEATGTLTSQDAVSASLAISSRTIDWKAGTVAVTLTTDEFSLQTEANRTTSSISYRAHQSSLIAVVNAVLADIGTTATLGASSVDADVTTAQELTNLVPDPRTQSSASVTDVFGTSSKNANNNTSVSINPSGKFQQATWAAATTGPGLWFCGNTSNTVSVTGGILFAALSIDCNAAVTANITVDQFDSTGHEIASTVICSQAIASGTWTRLSGTLALRSNTAAICVAATASGARAAGFQMNISSMLVCVNPLGAYETDDTTELAYWDGTTTANEYYTYSWDGTANASTSTRTPVVDRSPDSLAVSPGESYWDMLDPVLAAAGLSLFCDENGVWRLVDGSSYSAPGTAIVQQSNATALQDAVTLTDPTTVYNSVVVKYTWTDVNGITQTRYDAAGDGSPTQLVEFDSRPYPGPGAAAYILSKGEGRGRVMTTTALNDFAVRPYMGARIVAPYTQTQTGIVSAVRFDLASAEMSLTTRGLIDTPAGAWTLAPDTVTWDDGDTTTTWDALEDDFSNLT
ncbi:hypothetical protein [Humibacter albus]|uniref:hypothetical protein n=1 Tax=Humibacter albus TaxID=427754 RepID=UPI0003B6CDF8|nr:hypothetical protein [Humibacter albus]